MFRMTWLFQIVAFAAVLYSIGRTHSLETKNVTPSMSSVKIDVTQPKHDSGFQRVRGVDMLHRILSRGKTMLSGTHTRPDNMERFKLAPRLKAAIPQKSRGKRQAVVVIQLAPDAVGAPVFDAFRGDDIGPYDDAFFDYNLLSIFPPITDAGETATTAIPVVAAPP